MRTPPENSAWIPPLISVCLKSDNFGSLMNTALWPSTFDINTKENMMKIFSSSKYTEQDMTNIFFIYIQIFLENWILNAFSTPNPRSRTYLLGLNLSYSVLHIWAKMWEIVISPNFSKFLQSFLVMNKKYIWSWREDDLTTEPPQPLETLEKSAKIPTAKISLALPYKSIYKSTSCIRQSLFWAKLAEIAQTLVQVEVQNVILFQNKIPGLLSFVKVFWGLSGAYPV